MLVKRNFQTRLLIHWWHTRQPVKGHIRKSLWIDNWFYHVFSLAIQIPGLALLKWFSLTIAVIYSSCLIWHWLVGITTARQSHYGDVIMGAMASEITSLAIVYSNVHSDADQRKHQSSALLAFVRGIHRGPVNSTHKGPITRKMFPFDDVIMQKPHYTMTNYYSISSNFNKISVTTTSHGPLLLTWINVNPRMDK